MTAFDIVSIFKSVQGEGRYAGTPAKFIRLADCNKDCDWCDTEFELEYRLDVDEVVEEIEQENIVIWTGGEPLLQFDAIIEVIKKTPQVEHHLETNGSILDKRLELFDYIAFSPKNIDDAIALNEFRTILDVEHDVKVVTDMIKVNCDLIDFATMLMPKTLTDEEMETYGISQQKAVKRLVWNHCSRNDVDYSPRLHTDVYHAGYEEDQYHEKSIYEFVYGDRDE